MDLHATVKAVPDSTIRESKSLKMQTPTVAEIENLNLTLEINVPYETMPLERASELLKIAQICSASCWALIKEGAEETAKAVAQAAFQSLGAHEREPMAANLLARMGIEISGSSDRAAIRTSSILSKALKEWGSPFIEGAVSLWVKEGLALAGEPQKSDARSLLANNLDNGLSRHWIWEDAFAQEVKKAPKEAGWGWIFGENLKATAEKRVPCVWRWGAFGGELWAHLAWHDEVRGAKALSFLILRGNANQGEVLASAQIFLNAQRIHAASNANGEEEQVNAQEKWARLTVLLAAFSERIWRVSGLDETALRERDQKWGDERAVLKSTAFAPGEKSPLAIAVRSERSRAAFSEGLAALWPSANIDFVNRRAEAFLLAMGENVAAPVLTDWLLEMSAGKYGIHWQKGAKAVIPLFVGERVRDIEFMSQPGLAEAIFSLSDDLSFAQSVTGFERLISQSAIKELLRALQDMSPLAKTQNGSLQTQEDFAATSIHDAQIQKRGLDIWKRIFNAPVASLPSHLPIKNGARAQERYDNEAHALMGFAQTLSRMDSPSLDPFFVEGFEWLMRRGWEPMAEGHEMGAKNSFVHAARDAVSDTSAPTGTPGRKEKMLAWLEKIELEEISKINSGASGKSNEIANMDSAKARGAPRL